MPVISLKIDSCTECIFLDRERVYTSDSWENVEKWKCKKKRNKIITSYHEWSDKTEVPKWCPILMK